MTNEKRRTTEGNVFNNQPDYNKYLRKLSSGSQNWKVLKYIKEHGSITQLEASDHLRITRLPARVHDLRAIGCPVESKTIVRKDGSHYSRYYLGVES